MKKVLPRWPQGRTKNSLPAKCNPAARQVVATPLGALVTAMFRLALSMFAAALRSAAPVLGVPLRTHSCEPWSAALLLCSLVATPHVIGAQELHVPTLTVSRPPEGDRPTIDGRVDDDVWEAAEPFSTFIQQEPNEGAPATEVTEIRFLLDERNLYVAVVCFDSEPANIVVSQRRRDAELEDTDSVRILLDTFRAVAGLGQRRLAQ